MEEIISTSEKLRSRDECERQLAVELAVGAVDSIDSLIESGHEVACEYACQLLFDNLRQKVAEREGLPLKIINHLLNDRVVDIRLTVIKTNWWSLSPEQQEEIIQEAELIFSNETENAKKIRESRWNSARRLTGKMTAIINPLLVKALNDREETAAMRYLNIIGCANGLPIPDEELIKVLKDLPKVFHKYWKSTSDYSRKQDLILAHPDEKVRMKEVELIVNKKTKVHDLYGWSSAIGKAHRGLGLKAKILKLWCNDPSPTIRRYIAMSTTNTEVLSQLAADESSIVSRIAYPRFKQFQKRAAYSQAYHERKQEKARTSNW